MFRSTNAPPVYDGAAYDSLELSIDRKLDCWDNLDGVRTTVTLGAILTCRVS